MKKSALLITLFLSTSSFCSFGQLYEKIYQESNSEIQNKIDQNKISGIDILTGIYAKHIIGLAGLSIPQKSTLEQILNNIPSVKSFVLSNDLSSVVIESNPTFLVDDFAAEIESLNGFITGKSITYYINEQ